MRVILIGPAHPLRGGIANFNQALCSAFVKMNKYASIESYSLQYPNFLFPGKTQFEEGDPPTDISITSNINSINPITWFKVAKRIKKAAPDYVIIHFWMPFFAPTLLNITRIIKKRTNIKVIVIVHNAIPHEKRLGDAFLTKRFFSQCDGFITMSKTVLADVNSIVPKTDKLCIPHPIYNIFGEKINRKKAINKLHLKEEERYLLFFGIIRRYKGLDLLLKAMGDERIKKQNIKLIVAGEFYEDRSYYDLLINKYQIAENIIICNHFISSNDVKYYFSIADMVVQPYHTATQSGVTQIAYNFECPMLVTDVGGLAETVPAGKVGYVTSTDPLSIANAILDFYENNRKQTFSQNVVIEKEKYSWDKMVFAIENLVRKLKLEDNIKKN